MADYSLLKDFLKSGLTQKAFAEKKKQKYQKITYQLWKQMMTLYKNGIVIPEMYCWELRYAKKHSKQILNILKDV